MGGNSTSHSAVLTDKKTQSSGAFDLQSWQGLTALLKAGKEAIVDVNEYAEFRNLVLQYAQHGGDVELKQKISAVIRSFTSVPPLDAPHTAPTPVTVAEAAPQNPEPSFLPHLDVPDEAKNVGNDAPSAPTRRLIPRFEENIKRENRKDTPVVPETNSQDAEPVLPPVEPQMTQPLSHTESKIIEASPKLEPSIPSMPEPAQPEAISKAPSSDNHKARIAEIKNSVHSLFGNPAALMNLHNGIGQIYMKALLMAMKATSPGSDENGDMRMAELEKAYKALTDESTTIIEPTLVAESEVEEEVATTPLTPAEIALPGAEEISIPQAPLREEIIPEIVPERFSIAPQEDMEVAEAPEPEIKYSAKHTLEQLSSKTNQLKMRAYLPEDENSDLATTSPTVPHATNSPQASKTEGTYGDMRKTNTAYTNVADRPTVSEIDSKQSELVSEEISAALKKLLHDWTIFEGSGLFGIGPGGIDHPLYQKLAPLSMGEVIAGRWEKSDPKITKTIKEYVDAWRHEQGIAYTINETFEHYLRRVIQRILRRQSA